MVFSESYELKNDQKEWITNNTEKVYSLLEATPPDGKEFAAIVKNVLSREELWNIWKNDSCPGKRKYFYVVTFMLGYRNAEISNFFFNDAYNLYVLYTIKTTGFGVSLSPQYEQPSPSESSLCLRYSLKQAYPVKDKGDKIVIMAGLLRSFALPRHGFKPI